jgi:Fic family protein
MQGFGFQMRSEASLVTLTADVVKSSAIEGEFLDPEQVRSSIARRFGVEIGDLVDVSRDVEGIVEMMLDATQRYAEPLTADRLFGWHSILFPSGRSRMLKIKVGDWRTADAGAMQIVTGPIGRESVHFEAPAAERLALEMIKFLSWFESNQNLDPVM